MTGHLAGHAGKRLPGAVGPGFKAFPEVGAGGNVGAAPLHQAELDRPDLAADLPLDEHLQILADAA